MKKNLFLTIALLCVSMSAMSQGLRDIKINEILVKNVDSYADDHAHKVGWIELYNSGYSYANVAGAYLRLIQGSDTTTYKIPKNDTRTAMPPQGYLVFFANGSSNKGTFHTNFRLDVIDSVKWNSLVGINDRLELLDQSGRVVIDSLEYDVNTQVSDVSYGRIKTGEVDDNSQPIYKNSALTHITPMQSNETVEPKPKGEIFREQDPSGVVMAMIAMSVVFLALLMLYLIFRALGKFMHRGHQKKQASAVAPATTQVKSAHVGGGDEPSGETIAAIAAALSFYDNDMHDLESEVITINRVAKTYSPWSSKIYTLRQMPNRK